MYPPPIPESSDAIHNFPDPPVTCQLVGPLLPNACSIFRSNLIQYECLYLLQLKLINVHVGYGATVMPSSLLIPPTYIKHLEYHHITNNRPFPEFDHACFL